LDYATKDGTFNKEASFDNSDYNNGTKWGAGESFSVKGTVITKPTGTILTSTSNTYTMDTPNLLGIIDTTTVANSSFGIGIATGLVGSEENKDKKSVIVYPTGVSKSTNECYASLGTSDMLWNIYANIIDCASLTASTGVLAAKSIFMNNELVATQAYVYNLLVDVWNAIKSTKSGVGSNVAGIGKLGAALESQVVTHVDLGKSGQGGVNLFSFQSKDHTELYSLWAPMVGHSHEVKLAIVDT
jgi:hypothetical protein